jgi:pimeloyl-[acyl-carrier protein] methyl ester esterase
MNKKFSLHVQTQGSGPDLVLLHGWGMNASVWEEFCALLTPGYRLHRVDLPGHGISAMCRPYSLPRLVKVLQQRFRAPVDVCGWSMGGQIALGWAGLFPAQVRRLILISTTPRFVNTPDWRNGIEKNVLDDFCAELEQNYAGAIKRFLSLQVPNASGNRAMIKTLKDGFEAHPPSGGALRAGAQLLAGNDLRPLVRKITCPSLILHGARDVLVPPAAGRWLARNLPHSKHRFFANGAHAPFLSHAGQCADSILRFAHG